jgi:hypothetical protein
MPNALWILSDRTCERSLILTANFTRGTEDTDEIRYHDAQSSAAGDERTLMTAVLCSLCESESAGTERVNRHETETFSGVVVS